jgi:hypothetical protein
MNQLVKVVLVGDSNRFGIILNGKLVLSSDG